MKFKTRLVITFLTIILLPLVLACTAFICIGGALIRGQEEYGLRNKDYNMLIDPTQASKLMADEIFLEVREILDYEPSGIEDEAVLSGINEKIVNRSSYIIVRRQDELFYTGNQLAANQIFSELPHFREENVRENEKQNIYLDDMKKLVRQMDFYFENGDEGSFFVITRTNPIISRRLFVDMAIAIMVILIFTSMFLTNWISRGVFAPINQLNVAMQNIAEGNLEYRLPDKDDGEIGELYRNYEDMRLRLKESTDEKILAEKQNKELVSNISHDLKTPITAIKGYVEGIMDGVADTPEKMDKYIRTIYNKANDMDRLINELTVYSGIDSNRIPYHFHKIDVSEYFGDCIEEVGLDLESKNIELNYSNLVTPGTLIIADPEQLKRVINNIIGNSVKYIDKKKGEIDIRILDELDSIRVEIEDNGKGIAAKDLPKIFERFYRTDTSRNSAQGGSGIGLSIVKKIVEDHGGYIWATSKENEGTCMHFVIRKYQEAE
ncbi:sensor histidine kinase [Parablautia intestinalis]|jgi:signal transduction histidine kinase|uniref:histidine kinase n=1 Tax=Parablautia intestinalis TaxID=2320100 RepID=A0A3A9AK44_9FIRM|nr:HAMP domain-containing sensor histidine kinase [Parablautia intestinalis]MCI8615243.1 HAMP domain-containing histidine kinase [Lachnospiraceae bacterium]MDE7047094.1 HAMP domain-containing histidine kinase [Lachnospiraceae bacterium]RKI91960.1 sensor histidine kinase [Parablautia intestinalis]